MTGSPPWRSNAPAPEYAPRRRTVKPGSPYGLQNRSGGGITIRQGGSYITLRRSEIAQLVRDLNKRLDDPARVEETNGVQTANHG